LLDITRCSCIISNPIPETLFLPSLRQRHSANQEPLLRVLHSPKHKTIAIRIRVSRRTSRRISLRVESCLTSTSKFLHKTVRVASGKWLSVWTSHRTFDFVWQSEGRPGWVRVRLAWRPGLQLRSRKHGRQAWCIPAVSLSILVATSERRADLSEWTPSHERRATYYFVETKPRGQPAVPIHTTTVRILARRLPSLYRSTLFCLNQTCLP
jgi:hypothetical protein